MIEIPENRHLVFQFEINHIHVYVFKTIKNWHKPGEFAPADPRWRGQAAVCWTLCGLIISDWDHKFPQDVRLMLPFVYITDR